MCERLVAHFSIPLHTHSTQVLVDCWLLLVREYIQQFMIALLNYGNLVTNNWIYRTVLHNHRSHTHTNTHTQLHIHMHTHTRMHACTHTHTGTGHMKNVYLCKLFNITWKNLQLFHLFFKFLNFCLQIRYRFFHHLNLLLQLWLPGSQQWQLLSSRILLCTRKCA